MSKYLDKGRFKSNPYGPCVANKIITGESLTKVFHVDDAKANHKDTKLVDNFEKWI